jgi:hypothetical protein
MINLVEQIISLVDFNDDYFYLAKDKILLGYERDVIAHPITQAELLLLGREDFTEQPLSVDEAVMLLTNDVYRIEEQIKTLVPWEELGKPRQASCVNLAMIFGVNNFLRIERELDVLKNGHYETFVLIILKLNVSDKYASRVNIMAEQMLTGQWC